MTPRALVALLVLATVLAGMLWLSGPAAEPSGPPGRHAVFVVGPTTLLHEGAVEADPPTALGVLAALAHRDGFALHVDDPAGCAFDYVRGVDGWTESASGGWNYYVRSGEAWVWQDQAASCRVLQRGEDVLWCWVEPDETCGFYP